jgi:hypothetical protein
MEINELMMLTDDDIDYGDLPLDILEQLAFGDELFIATSALGELSRRDSSIAASVSWKILSCFQGDCYLQAAALEVLFQFDREKALNYIRTQAQSCNPYILNSIMQLMIENESDFKSDTTSSLVSIVLQRLKEFDSEAQYPEPEVRKNFLNTYGFIDNIQVMDAIQR